MFQDLINTFNCTTDIKNRLYDLDKNSKSQAGIDIFVAYATNFNKGYFVEFGASDGIKASNTFLLETELSWNGICSEPADTLYKQLLVNRKCHIDNSVIGETSNKPIYFLEEQEPYTAYSHVHGLPGSTKHKYKSKTIRNTISLNDLLLKFNAPDVIDYLSIDTKGSEFDILKGYDFNKKIKIISIDWATQYIQDRSQILFITKILVDKGYEQVYNNLSYQEGWFVLKNAGLTQW